VLLGCLAAAAAPAGAAAAAPPPPLADRRVLCPRCGEPAEPGQEVCLRCGAPVGRAYRRPPSWRLPAALAALGVLLVGAGAGFGIAELTHDNKSKKKPISLTPKQPVTPAPTGPTGPTTPTGPSGPTGATTPSGPSGPTGASTSVTLTSWPAGQKGWTVVLMVGKDRGKVEERARAAARSSISAGVLKGDDYQGFKPGVWVAFMGQYDKREGAQKAKKTYASKGFSGKPREITPKKK
jgi:hypothetical protein